MIKWEYISIITDTMEHPKLKELGSLGWEAVSFAPVTVAQGLRPNPVVAFLVLFKRPIMEPLN